MFVISDVNGHQGAVHQVKLSSVNCDCEELPPLIGSQQFSIPVIGVCESAATRRQILIQWGVL